MMFEFPDTNRVVASLPFNQVIPHLAAFPDTLEESLEVLKTSGDTAYYHLQAAQQPHEIYEGILGLMKIFEDACRLQIHLPPEQLDTVLVNKIVYGTHREVRVGSILHLLMFDINLWLCSAFQRLQMWDFVTVRASMAMEIAGMHGEHCYIPRETEHYLRVIRDHPR